MNQAYIYWLFTQQLEEQAQLARRTPKVIGPPRRRGTWPHWRSLVPQRSNPQGHAVPAKRAPMGCAV